MGFSRVLIYLWPDHQTHAGHNLQKGGERERGEKDSLEIY